MVDTIPILQALDSMHNFEINLPVSADSATSTNCFGGSRVGENAIWNSGKQIRCALCLAASLIKSMETLRFSALFTDDFICTTAIRGDFSTRYETVTKLKICWLKTTPIGLRSEPQELKKYRCLIICSL